jgi:putative glutamine amidotransferase
MTPPLIGITIHPVTAPDRADLDTLVEAIVQCVERAGGLPLLIPLGLGETTLRNLFARLDGLLFSGGGDVHPERYGAAWHEKLDGVDAERDRTELALARWAAAGDKPFFGICRGSQALNVALGGTLHRDTSECVEANRHTFSPGFPNDYLAHEIKVEEDSVLSRIVGRPVIAVNSLHHQAVKDVAPGLAVSARAPDGLVEAIEIPHHRFALAVQWHPECLPDAPEHQALFEAFVAAAGGRQIDR